MADNSISMIISFAHSCPIHFDDDPWVAAPYMANRYVCNIIEQLFLYVFYNVDHAWYDLYTHNFY